MDDGAVRRRMVPRATVVGAAMMLQIDHPVEQRRIAPIHTAHNAAHIVIQNRWPDSLVRLSIRIIEDRQRTISNRITADAGPAT